MDELQTVEILNPEVIFQQEKAQFDVAIATAKKYPRNLTRSIENAIVTVSLDFDTAQACNYALPRGGKTLQGPSIHLAKILMQCYGNFRAEAKVVAVDATHITSRGVAFDLENNIAISVEVKRSIIQNEWKWDETQKKSIKTGKMVRMNDDMITVTGNAANSIALRNAILAVIPQAVVNAVNKAAKSVVVGDISDEQKFLKRRVEIFKSFQDNLGVTDAEILFSLGKASITNVTPDDLVALIGFGQAIKDGDSTVDEVFRKKQGTDANEERNVAKEKQLQALWKAKEKFIPEDKIEDIRRIVENKETTSYDKAIKYLQPLTKPKK